MKEVNSCLWKIQEPCDLPHWLGTSHSCSADTVIHVGNSPLIGTCDFQVESESVDLSYIRSLMGWPADHRCMRMLVIEMHAGK